MGSLEGHLLPGTFFIIFGIWWSFITAIRFIHSRQRSIFKKNSLNGYKSSVTMPCICLPCAGPRRWPIESYFKLIFGCIGIYIEIRYGIEYRPIQVLNSNETRSSEPYIQMQTENKNQNAQDSNEHMHMHGKRSAHQPAMEWFITHNNQQHATMYSAFVLGSIVEIMMYHGVRLPTKLDYVCGILAFFVEGFLFSNHLHSRAPLDVHIHTLLVYAIFGCAILSIFETCYLNNILLTYGRIFFTIFQGTWFWQVGFVIYPPWHNPKYIWDPNDHNQIMTITMSYCWHAILIVAGLIIQLLIMQRIYGSSKKIANEWDELIIIDYESTNHESNIAILNSELNLESQPLDVNENSDNDPV
jgi:hypothetical protein